MACGSSDVVKLPEIVYVLCTSSFPGETLTYDRIATYTCNITGVIISASFLCDGTMQCEEGDDEINCAIHNVASVDCSPFSLQMHKNSDCLMCSEFYIACGNGVCVPQDALCNGFSDCDDGWDEQICVFSYSQLSFVTESKHNRTLSQCKDGSLYDIDYRCIFEHDGMNNILHCADSSHVFDCETLGCTQAFKCSLSYCIPLRQVCDGMSDCQTGEDEASCQQLQCTGLLQCRQSARCLPPWDICDGTVHCKDFLDDEIYCAPCPPGMRCHGNAAVCTGNADVGMPSMASQSWVKVVHCRQKASVQALSAVVWHTLTYLDVQHSEISHLDFDLLFSSMKVLSYLNAAFNKIVLIKSRSVTSLNILNLSHNMITILRTFGLRHVPNLITLVLHHNDISVIQRWAFIGLKALVSIDITHNPLVIHEVSDLPQESYFLEHFHGDILAMCCLLSHVPHCTPQSSLFSSCKNMLHLTVYRVLITGQAVLTFIANSAVIIFRRYLHQKEQFQMLQLTASNLLMSMYFMMMTAVDIYYRDRFALVAVGWKYLSFCKLAASVNMIASEVSLSLLLLIFLLRAYAIHKVLSTGYSRFKKVTCCVIWAVWVIYTSTFAGILSMTDSPLESNICILVYFNHATRSYLALGHSIVYGAVNMLIVIALVMSYGFIAYSVLKKNPELQRVCKNRVRQNREVARRLVIMFFFNISCWIPILTTVSLSLTGVAMPNDVSVWMAIIVVPINASFCPIMFCLMPMLVNALKKK